MAITLTEACDRIRAAGVKVDETKSGKKYRRNILILFLESNAEHFQKHFMKDGKIIDMRDRCYHIADHGGDMRRSVIDIVELFTRNEILDDIIGNNGV